VPSSAPPRWYALAARSCAPEVQFDSVAVPGDSAALRWHALGVDFPGQGARWYEPEADFREPAAACESEEVPSYSAPRWYALAARSCALEVQFDSVAVPGDSAALRWHALGVDFPGQGARWYEPEADSPEPVVRLCALGPPHD
jgi:hypothetical protein